MSVPRMGVGKNAATTIAPVIELATNFLEHGALSSPTGVLDTCCDPGGDTISLVWAEQGGRVVTPPATTNSSTAG